MSKQCFQRKYFWTKLLTQDISGQKNMVLGRLVNLLFCQNTKVFNEGNNEERMGADKLGEGQACSQI
jgi:hypothetical protein